MRSRDARTPVEDIDAHRATPSLSCREQLLRSAPCTLHGLSDVLPARVHLTVPSSWSRRRLRVPRGVVLAFAHVPKSDRGWVGTVQVTSVRRTLEDCATAAVAPDLVQQALREAATRGLVSRAELDRIARAARGAEGRAP